MDVKELKFVLKLIGKPNYRGKISDLKPTDKTKVSETQKICRNLRDRELVATSEKITKIKIIDAGKGLLKVDAADLPITAEELKILKACSKKDTITPSQTKVKADKREEAIDNLIQRGLIAAVKTEIKEVWITDRGKEHLVKEYNPKGTNSVLSLNLLNNYLCFLRKYFSSSLQSPVIKPVTENGKHPIATYKLSDEEVLQTIIDLDRQLGTDNYLPIFHLRNQLQPPLSRDELDQALYRLERQDKIELSSLVEAVHYTKEQIEAGIPQDVGGCLFFVMVS